MSAGVYDIHTKKDKWPLKRLCLWKTVRHLKRRFNIIYKSQELQTWFQDNKHFLSYLGQYMMEREPKYPITDFDFCIFCSMKMFSSETMLFVWLSLFYIYIVLINSWKRINSCIQYLHNFHFLIIQMLCMLINLIPHEASIWTEKSDV